MARAPATAADAGDGAAARCTAARDGTAAGWTAVIPRTALGLVLVTACGSSAATPDASATDSANGVLSLDDCPTSIADDVPAPYKSLFRCVTATRSGDSLVITTSGLPPHKTYYYGANSPNYEAWDARGGAYHANPNTLVASTTTFTIPLAPVSRGLTITSSLVDGIVNNPVDEYRGGPVGLALDSVLLFDALAAPGDDISVEVYTFDEWSAHPAPTGQYHYHSNAPGPLAVLARAGLTGVEAYGVMCDGTIVLGCTELDGSAPATADLDAQNGHVHDVVDGAGATIAARYHVHLCPAWTDHPRPYTPEIQFYEQCTAH